MRTYCCPGFVVPKREFGLTKIQRTFDRRFSSNWRSSCGTRTHYTWARGDFNNNILSPIWTIFLVQCWLALEWYKFVRLNVTRMDTLYMEENGRQNEGPTQHELPELEKDNDQEVSSSSREKVATDVGGNKGGGIGTPKKRARATELQKLQVWM